MASSIENQAIKILKEAYGTEAKFRDGQLEAILSVVEKKKTLVVQKTGWGKSVVYFIATKILREQGSGPTIIVSPLLALMKNQIDSAAVLGINAVTINSDNKDLWEELYATLDSYDAIIISPERLSNDTFMSYLSEIPNIQLFVVDEAHSISDWGHDFRPDYQRIVRLIDNFPVDIAILGTTATANNRVIVDIKKQLGNDLVVVRGDLIRENLAIQINAKQNREERLAWLGQSLSVGGDLENGQGIIYCLTKRDCETVSGFLKRKGISVEAYYSGLKDELGNDLAQKHLQDFDDGKIRVLIATIKLGMGYDKPDIRFVIHYQLPQNLISYYQQIGRAGRDGKKAYAILLHGNEDEDILNFFIEGAQAKPELLSTIMDFTVNGAKFNEMLPEINVQYGKLGDALKYLLVHEHIYKDGPVYRRNINATFNNETERLKQEELNVVRYRELTKLKEYLSTENCYMKFVADELDAPDKKEKCGICRNCVGTEIISTSIDDNTINEARAFLKNRHGKIIPRKMWGTGGRIAKDRVMEEGWILSDDYYSEVGQKVKQGKYTAKHYSDEIVLLAKNFLHDKVKQSQIDTIMAVPSLRRPDLVPDFARALAEALSQPFEIAIQKTEVAAEQKTLLNSAQQQENIENSISIDPAKVFDRTILLVDDMVDSKWTFTVIAAKLLDAGAKAVFPFALVKTGSGD